MEQCVSTALEYVQLLLYLEIKSYFSRVSIEHHSQTYVQFSAAVQTEHTDISQSGGNIGSIWRASKKLYYDVKYVLFGPFGQER